MTGSVDIGEESEAVLAQLLAKGSYASRDAALREGVRLLQYHQTRLARFEVEIGRGMDDVAAGRTEDADLVFDRLIAKYEALAAKSAA